MLTKKSRIPNALTAGVALFLLGGCSTDLPVATSGEAATGFTIAKSAESPGSELESRSFPAVQMSLTDYKRASSEGREYIQLTGSTGRAEFKFPLATGFYDIDVSYLSEAEGRNTYGFYIDEQQIISWLDKDRDDTWHLLSEQQWHSPRHIKIENGAVIAIESLADNGSLAIFDAIHFSPSTREDSMLSSQPLRTAPEHTPVELLGPTDDWITVNPEVYTKALKNPLKGFRHKSNAYATLFKDYIYWNQIENSASDGVEKILAYSNQAWSGIEEKNLKVIPRVYLSWPGRGSGWPADMETGDYSSAQFKERVLSLIEKMGTAWNEDPRVAFIEMGLIGSWGEQEFPSTTADIRSAIAAQFNASFPDKTVMIRWPHTYDDHLYNFGYYWDSFGHHDQNYYAYHLNRTSPRWETAVIGGEVAYDWGNADIQAGTSPEESLTVPAHRDHLIDQIRSLHVNHLGWISMYDATDPEVQAGAEQMQKAFGYRFVLTEASYPKRLETDEIFSVAMKVKNTGSTPFYADWPLELSLLDPVSREVVWREQFAEVDLRAWLPGKHWDLVSKAYTTSPETYTIHGNFEAPDLEPGAYILAVSVIDPAGGEPSLRFAIENYFKGGRHPLGLVGVNQAIDSFTVEDFDDPRADDTISYKVP